MTQFRMKNFTDLIKQWAVDRNLHTADPNKQMQMDIDITECIKLSYDEIKDRKGKMIDGVFVKEADLS